ncbi:sigma-54-dependent Fis family transcriptional regulator [Geosporobacter ferrireducens]|uniref:Sigma-54-dependent Fis family transcriptional regulator n=1 Tax=Geosporobacter ferrireducens TaxID=1424294 RepID=A0A1D8GIL6_9FIRM|nr:sigma 54-interacting transcriptional regulator [Geosporobacter ferrireducens]AOT70739.1 sigma-54-dependent Fis family transcriptional regulator [Geosporobacter ferrireducens]MTI57545.1 PAS domain-containing protein [Geosporobacter ferrireducens]
MEKIAAHRFIERYEIHRSLVEDSHKRSEDYGVKKDTTYIPDGFKGKRLEELLLENEELLRISKPITETLYNYVKDTGFFLEVIDKNGIILNIIGDDDIEKRSLDMNMIVGTDMSEKSAGTNAISLALQEDCPIQLVGEEHYLEIFHQFTCSAAVVHNEERNIIGCINLTGWSNRVHKHTLALVVAAVRSIENQIKVGRKQNELTEAYNYTNTIMNSLDIGILAVDFDGRIKLINYAACKMINIYKEEAVGHNIFQLIEDGMELRRLLVKGKQVENKEINIVISGRTKKFVLSSNQSYDKNHKLSGYIIILKDIRTVFKLVNQYVGMTAQYDFDMIIGKSPELLQVKEYAKKVSKSPSTILIQGESGTGKELLAQAIHNNSDRAHNSFVAINCGAIPNSLIESELFGYVEGAFTGARKGGYSGKLALADKGTLFLDEIGEMPLHMQVHLLRFLQEGRITRLGDNKVIYLDVRIIAATNKDLKEEVKMGRFREDLYYRLSVIPIYLPPLRDRSGDIGLLIEYFLRNKAISLRKEIPQIKGALYKKLLAYHWPGNIRELENCIENIVNFDGEMSFAIDADNLADSQPQEAAYIQEDRLQSLESIEKEAIKNCLHACNQNYSMAAKILGITRSTLYAKIKKYKIESA